MAKLNADKVPRSLVHLVPLAEKWGLHEDVGDRVCNASCEEVEELAGQFDKLTESEVDDLSDWLGGVDWHNNPDPEYVAFSDLQMAFDLANARMQALQKGRSKGG